MQLPEDVAIHFILCRFVATVVFEMALHLLLLVSLSTEGGAFTLLSIGFMPDLLQQKYCVANEVLDLKKIKNCVANEILVL